MIDRTDYNHVSLFAHSKLLLRITSAMRLRCLIVWPSNSAIRYLNLDNAVSILVPKTAPPTESLEDGVPIPENLRKGAPRRSNPHNPQNSSDEKPVVRARAPWIPHFSRKKRRDPLPLIIAQDPPFQGHLLLATLNQN